MRIAIDNIIFQLQKGRPRLVLLQRQNSDLTSYGIKTFPILTYNIGTREKDVKMLTSVCKKLKIDLFITTYQTRVNGIKSLAFVHDLIPEILGWLPTICRGSK